MADEKISALPSAGTLDGSEPVPVVKDGVTKQTTAQDIANLASGGGDVVGPASSVNNNIAIYDGTTGKLIKDGGYSVSTSTGDSASAVKVPVWSVIVSYVTGLGYLLASTASSTYQAILTAANFGTFLTGLTAKNTLVDADEVLSSDSAASNAAKKTTWLNVWTNYIKVKSDAIYASKTFVESISLQDNGTSIAATTYTIELYANYAYTINELKIVADAGTCTANLKINSTSVTSISAVSVSSTIATATASGANTVAVGDKITLVTTSNSGLNNLQLTIKTTRI